MILLLTFAAIFLVGQATNVGIALAVEHLSEPASLAMFFALFAVVVIGGWQLAVRLTDRLFGPGRP
jgi:type III secretory pathway component EscR